MRTIVNGRKHGNNLQLFGGIYYVTKNFQLSPFPSQYYYNLFNKQYLLHKKVDFRRGARRLALGNYAAP